jgi:hypothetical protein
MSIADSGGWGDNGVVVSVVLVVLDGGGSNRVDG